MTSVSSITADILQAVDGHLEQGYGGPEFPFSKTGDFPRYIDSRVRPLKRVGGIRSRAEPSPAASRSRRLGSGAQRRLMEALKPGRAPHELAVHAPVDQASTGSHTPLHAGRITKAKRP